MAGKDTPTRRYRLSTQDATFIYAENPNNPLHIGSILMFEGKIDFDDFVQHVESRLHLVPRYRQRLMQVPFNLGHAVLEDDPNFRIENHVIRHLLRPGMNQSEAIDEMLRHYEIPLDYKRPLWEMHSFENLEGARTAIVSKVHHALVDGVSGVELLKVMFDLKEHPDPIEPPAEPWEPEEPSTPMRRFLEAMRDATAAPVKTAIETSRGLMREHGHRRTAATDANHHASHRVDAVEFRAGGAAALARVVNDVVRRFSQNSQRLRRLHQRCSFDDSDRGGGALPAASWICGQRPALHRMSGERAA
jgi:WS/DGAT/MGAT family acyltransferase